MNAYYTALLNAAERSVHLHGPSRLPVVNYFSIITIAKHIMEYIKESHVSPITPQVVCNLSTTAYLIAKRRQRLWQTFSLQHSTL